MKSMFLLLLSITILSNKLPVDEAKLLIAQKKYQAALQVLSSDETIEAHYFRGFCHFHLGNCSAASQSFNIFIQSENKYQSESWKTEARILLNKCQNTSTGAVLVQNQPKKSSKAEIVKAEYQKSYKAIVNAYNQQNRYEDSIKNVETFKIDLDNTKLKSFIIKANDNSIVDSKGNEKVLLDSKPSEKIITPAPDPKQETAIAINSKPIPDVVTKTDKDPITPKPDQNQNSSPAVTVKPVADIASKTNSQPEEKIDITVAEQKHHYKILFTIENQPDKTFMSLANIGPVTYEKANGNNYMYYIGFFQTEEKAVDARDKVKAAGYKMARVMEFNKGQLEKEHISSDNQKPVEQEIVTSKIPEVPAKEEKENNPIPAQQIQEIIKSDVISYHILFRVLPDAYQKFDDLKHLGPLYRETYDAKGNSRYLIGNTDSKAEATKLLVAVKKAGYPASFIAEYINGQLSQIITE